MLQRFVGWKAKPNPICKLEQTDEFGHNMKATVGVPKATHKTTAQQCSLARKQEEEGKTQKIHK